MSKDKKNQVFEKLLEIISGFGETMINIEEQLEYLNQKISRLELKIEDYGKKADQPELTLEQELSRLETDLKKPAITHKEMKEIEEMEKELLKTDDEVDIEEFEKLEE
ncbi:MAG: hypothetical protein GF329_21040 [Candidatus Lokiarchaeota archaeon]|nr:hypothetical protein [Candidatus Lokiarchaeota archaeon]